MIPEREEEGRGEEGRADERRGEKERQGEERERGKGKREDWREGGIEREIFKEQLTHLSGISTGKTEYIITTNWMLFSPLPKYRFHLHHHLVC